MAVSRQQARLAQALIRAKQRKGFIANSNRGYPAVTQLRNAGGSSLALALSDLNSVNAGRIGVPFEMVRVPIVRQQGPQAFSYSYDGPIRALPEDVVARQSSDYIGEAAFFSKSSATEASLPNASGNIQLSDQDWGSGGGGDAADPYGLDSQQGDAYPEYGNDDSVDDTFSASGQAFEGDDDGLGQLPDVLSQGVQALQNADAQAAIAAGAPVAPPSAVSSLATSLFGTPAQKAALQQQQVAAAQSKAPGMSTAVKVALALAAVGAVVYFKPWKSSALKPVVKPVEKAMNWAKDLVV